MKKIQFLTFTLLLAFTPFLTTKVATAQLKATLEGHTDNVWSVAFSPDGRTLASGSYDQTIRLWNVNTRHLLHTLTGHRNEVMSVAFSPDGQTLASASWDGTIRLWNPNTGKPKRTLTEHTGGVASVVFSSDGQTLASSADQTIRLWNARTWKLEKTLRGHTDVIDAVAFSPDGQTLASGSRDATIRLWNPNTGKPKRILIGHGNAITRVAFSLDGRTLASGSPDKTVRLWDPGTGTSKTTLAHRGGWATPVVFSLDGATLLIGGRGISIWDTQTGAYKKPLIRDIGADFFSVVFSRNGEMVASGSADGKVRLWKYNPSDLEIPTIDTNGMVRLINFRPNDRPVRRRERATALRKLIKDTQQLFADEMQSHGFGRKTFSVETDENGEPVVYHIDGKFPESHYTGWGLDHKVWMEIVEHFDDTDFQHIHFVAMDFSEAHGADIGGVATITSYDPSGRGVIFIGPEIVAGVKAFGGFAVISAPGDLSERIRVSAHELGHAFGLGHDFRGSRNNEYLMGYGSQSHLSQCSAEWLSVHPFFNTQPIAANAPTELQLLSVRAYSRETVSLRFKVTDPDGLHHAQLLLPELNPDGDVSIPRTLFDCKQLKGKTSTFESVVRTEVLIDRATLQIIDVNGNITWSTFPVELDAVVSEENVLDANNDGVVNTTDLTHIASQLGASGKNPADVNADAGVDTRDLLFVAASLSSLSPQAVEMFVATDVQKWLNDAKQMRIENEYQQKGIVFLEYLLAEIVLLSKPTETVITPLTAIFEGHTDLVPSVVFSPDGQTLASASRDTTIRLWDPLTSAPKFLLIGHTRTVNDIAFSPDGQTLASASRDTTIRLWDPLTGQHKTTLRAHTGLTYVSFTAIAFSPHGETLATGGDYSDPVIRLWNIHNQENVRTFTGHTNRITSVAFSPDGQTLVSGSWDETVRLWNANTGDHLRTLQHTAKVKSVIFSPDGQTLASASQDGSIRLWNPRNGEENGILTGNTDWIEQIAFSPDGEILASGSQNRRIRFWNTKQPQYQEALEENARSVMSVVFSPDGTTLASSRADKTVQLWDVQTLLDQSPTFEIGPNKITGPWLWMIAPTEAGQGGANSTDVDSLADASGGNVTEAEVAANGAREGDAVGNYVWTLGEISPTGDDNVNNLLNKIGLGSGDVDDHSSYALITLESTTAQPDVTMRVGSDDSIKVWLNGEVVHNNPVNRGAQDFQEKFTVDLKQGDNLLLVKVSDYQAGWSMFVGIEADVNAVYKPTSDTRAPVNVADINEDGRVNITDLQLVVTALSEKALPHPRTDVNGDGAVSVADLLLVIENLDDPVNAAAPVVSKEITISLDTEMLEGQLNILRAESDGSRKYQKAIGLLQSLLAAIRPNKTQLLANYPNPFNPETWIPYQLANPSDVRIIIYDTRGVVVRRLELGHQRAAHYTSRSRAAYWDGRNAVGERVASGVYFYQLQADNLSFLRKMVIRK